jgi:prevent-host-death family protein
MVAEPINIYDAKTRLSALVAEVEAGHEITIARAGRPVAKLVPIAKRGPVDRKGMFGIAKGKTGIADDFDTWPEGFIESLTEGM